MRNIDDMYLFKTVAERRSLNAASRDLCMPKSTLSRRLASLEESLGLPLFNKTGRELQLTNFGSECLDHCRKIAQEADAIFFLAEKYKTVPDGFLHIIFPPLLGEQVIEDIALGFTLDHPGIRIHIDTGITIFDPRSESADMIIYVAFEDLPDLNVVARKIVAAPYALVAAPGLFGSAAPPATPDALSDWPCLALGQKQPQASWALLRDGESLDLDFTPRLSTTHLPTLRRAALKGLGIAALPALACVDDLAAGRLLRVLPDWRTAPGIIHAIYPSGKSLTTAGRKALEIFVENIKRHVAAFDF
ncbi:LysR substrate-binding domain-containing protein [Burkholderia sp. A1]|uniref:LysR substrate-binding domain-containing protein n=1 Tax=Burkholderia sp. A1 TaxID=148446 RepID=UPI00046A40FB|nr:LysR substrate-binding domain-containing protein [Burkholderia sp. A1]